MVKRKLPPLKTEHYTKILIEICREHPSVQELSKRVKKKISTISDQLKVLEELQCVKRQMNRNPFYNTKEVLIDWKGLTHQYLKYLIEDLKINLKQSNLESYYNNKYLQDLIKLAIRDHQKFYHNTRIISPMNKIFEKITMQIVYADENFSNRILKSLKKKDARFYNFIQFTKTIKNQTTADYRRTYGKFLRGVANEINTKKNSQKK